MIKTTPRTTTTKEAKEAVAVVAAHSYIHIQLYQNEKVNEICLLSTREEKNRQYYYSISMLHVYHQNTTWIII